MTSLPDDFQDFQVLPEHDDARIAPVKRRGFPIAASLGWIACLGVLAGQAYVVLYRQPAQAASYAEVLARHEQVIQTVTGEIGALQDTAKRLDEQQQRLDDLGASLGQLSLKQSAVADLRTDIEALRARIDDLSVRFKAVADARPRSVNPGIALQSSQKSPATPFKIYSMRGANEFRAVTLITATGQISQPLMPGDSFQGARIVSIGGGAVVLNRSGKDERISL